MKDLQVPNGEMNGHSFSGAIFNQIRFSKGHSRSRFREWLVIAIDQLRRMQWLGFLKVHIGFIQIVLRLQIHP